MVLVKKNGTWRMRTNYWALTKHTIKDKYPFSLIRLIKQTEYLTSESTVSIHIDYIHTCTHHMNLRFSQFYHQNFQ